MTPPTHWRTVPITQDRVTNGIWCEALHKFLEPCEPPVATAGKEVWRLLEEGEQTKPGDEIREIFRWSKVTAIWTIKTHEVIRRRVTIPIAGWPQPRYDDPAKCGRPSRVILEFVDGRSWGVFNSNDWVEGNPWIEMPPDPEPEKSEADRAWEAVNTRMPMLSAKEIFMAGRESVKAKGGA